MSSARQTEIETLIDLGVERAVLGNALLDAVAVPVVVDVPSVLYHKDAHRAIADAMRALAGRGVTVEPGTVKAELERAGRWPEDGQALLATLEEEATVSTSLPAYIETLRELAARRELVRVSREVGHQALDRSRPIGSVLTNHLAAVAALEEQGVPSPILTPDMVAQEMDHLTELDRVATGLYVYDLDGGLTVGDLHVLAARTRMGKTSAGLQIAHHASKVLGLPVLFLSLEMSRRQIFLRLRGLDNSVAMRDSGFHIADPVGVTASEATSIIRRAVAQHAVQLVVVDHLQQVAHDPSAKWVDRRDLQIRDVCTKLVDAARGLNVPILALAQINRAGANANNPKPSLEHLQDGGAIEQTAASVTMLYTMDGSEDTENEVIDVEFAQRKNRHAGVKIWRARFLRPHRFEAA